MNAKTYYTHRGDRAVIHVLEANFLDNDGGFSADEEREEDEEEDLRTTTGDTLQEFEVYTCALKVVRCLARSLC